MKSLRLLLPLLCLSALPVQAQQTGKNPTFEPGADLAALQVLSGTLTRHNDKLQVELSAGTEWPQLRLDAPAPRDWSGKALSMQVKNAGQEAVEIGLRVDDDLNSDGWKHSWTGKWTLMAGQTRRVVLDWSADPMEVGMRGLPPLITTPGTQILLGQGEKPLDARHITGWQMFVSHPKTAVDLEVDGIGLVTPPSRNLDGTVDEFGQFSRATWLGKLRTASELSTRRESEAKTLGFTPQETNLDEFGGWKTGPQLIASGNFETQKIGGKWWLVDPLGHLFFSSGVDVVQPFNETMIAGREAMFAPIPAADTSLGKFRGQAGNVLRGPTKSGLTYDFARANLERKYGENWAAQWPDLTVRRLKSWGFNTVGNWSSDDLKSAALKQRLPYVATAWIGGDHARISDGADYWGKMHDPFDPQFAVDVRHGLVEIAAKIGNDPFCLGYFVDNELGWGSGEPGDAKNYFGLVYGTLNLPASAPAKREFLANLHQEYASFADLNAAWNLKLNGWQDLEAPFQAGDLTPAMRADFVRFLGHLADKYFATVAAQLKAVAPHHLYLGARFSGKPPLEVARASAKNCDVVSFNIYAPQIDAKNWAWLDELQKPVIVGEFHVGALDRGLFAPGLVAAKDQKERAQIFQSYLQSALDNPNFVGCHWFQYTDQPLTGRVLDGENYNIGFVDVTDTPYPEMIAAAREVNASIYARRNR